MASNRKRPSRRQIWADALIEAPRNSLAAINRLLGERIREARTRRGTSRAELARLVGATPAALRDHEGGRLHLRAEMLLRIADALRLDVRALFADDNPAVSRDTSMERALLRRLDLVALHKLAEIREPALKREIVRLITAAVESGHARDVSY